MLELLTDIHLVARSDDYCFVLFFYYTLPGPLFICGEFSHDLIKIAHAMAGISTKGPPTQHGRLKQGLENEILPTTV